jgi:plasmid replication initiation protein
MRTDLVKKNYFVKKDNAMTKALFFDMSLSAYRILLVAGTDKFLAQLNIPENKDRRIRITASEYHEIFGKEGSHPSPSYRALKQSVDELLDAKLRFKDFKNEHDDGKWSGGINWISYAAYNDKLKVLELSFSADILPFIHEVNTRYTYYNLRNIAELGSIHSVRMYELMMFWRKKGRTPPMSDKILKAWLGVRDDLYEDMRNFTVHIVKKAIKEINTKNTDIKIDLIINKKGKFTDSFVMALNDGKSSDDENSEEELDDDGLPKLNF